MGPLEDIAGVAQAKHHHMPSQTNVVLPSMRWMEMNIPQVHMKASELKVVLVSRNTGPDC